MAESDRLARARLAGCVDGRSRGGLGAGVLAASSAAASATPSVAFGIGTTFVAAPALCWRGWLRMTVFPWNGAKRSPANQNARRSQEPRGRIYPAPIQRKAIGRVNPVSATGGRFLATC